ncbi:hypothetical protein VTH8203_00954 [Vibrio thalassae]|uniref:Uncharacterized protein n=1 Tax=Vibrio thalassae TaxID=1243014 RepID=A0A240EGE5_9VIBR|nr:hypothetical protein VTH8203_00954 [Vibrio thalassae]
MKIAIFFATLALSLPITATASNHNGSGNVLGYTVQCTLPDGNVVRTQQLYCQLANGSARY